MEQLKTGDQLTTYAMRKNWRTSGHNQKSRPIGAHVEAISSPVRGASFSNFYTR